MTSFCAYLGCLLAASHVVADATFHSLATSNFAQDWSNTGLITADDVWSGVPSIIGFRGDDLTTATATDPQTVLADGAATPVDVIANQVDPNALVTGGVAEFEITNPTVALQGSGTADACHLVVHVDATGRSDVHVAFSARDIDGSSDSAIQPIAVHFRAGTSGSYTNVPTCFVADATTGPSLATLVTAVSCTLPASANGASQLRIRIMTTNAVGSDEWVGIDNIVVSSTATSSASADVTIVELGGSTTTTEATGAGHTDTFTLELVLASQPTADVTVTPSSSVPAEVTVSGALTFTSSTWSSAQTVTVTGVDDDVDDGDKTSVISFALTSQDANYNNLAIAKTVTVTNKDDDTAGVAVVATDGFTATTEAAGAGHTDTFTVALTSQPTANVVVALASDDTTEVEVSPTSLLFTSADWDVAQMVTVTGVDDAIVDGTQTASITFTVTSADAKYDGFAVTAVSVANADDDSAGATGACCAADINAVNKCNSISTSCATDEFFVVTAASSCSASLCCPAAPSGVQCPAGSSSTKFVVFTFTNTGLVPHTVCVNGWESTDANGTPPTGVVQRTLTLTSDILSLPTDTYNCQFGAATNPVSGFATSFQCLSAAQNEIQFKECESFCAGDNLACTYRRKRAILLPAAVGSIAAFTLASSAGGDPHLRGANGAQYDLKGVAGGVYALFVAPVFQINVQLAAVGPEARFMSKLSVLVGGTALTIGPWFKTRAVEIAAHFKALNATAQVKGSHLTVVLCDNHVIRVEARHTVGEDGQNYLNVAVEVPGCHDAYDGALGHTFQCAHVLHTRPFEWSAAREEAFRVDGLQSRSGAYRDDALCAREDEYANGDALFLLGGMSH